MKAIVTIQGYGGEQVYIFPYFTQYHRISTVLVCPFCLHLWAKLQYDQDLMFWPNAMPCKTCPWPTAWRDGEPGSLLYHDEVLLDFLPQPLLARELSIYFLSISSRITSMLTPEDLSKLQLYRARIAGGEQMPLEEAREAMRLLRSDRLNAAKRASVSKAGGAKVAKAPARPASELLGKLGIPGL